MLGPLSRSTFPGKASWPTSHNHRKWKPCTWVLHCYLNSKMLSFNGFRQGFVDVLWWFIARRTMYRHIEFAAIMVTITGHLIYESCVTTVTTVVMVFVMFDGLCWSYCHSCGWRGDIGWWFMMGSLCCVTVKDHTQWTAFRIIRMALTVAMTWVICINRVAFCESLVQWREIVHCMYLLVGDRFVFVCIHPIIIYRGMRILLPVSIRYTITRTSGNTMYKQSENKCYADTGVALLRQYMVNLKVLFVAI